MGLHELRVNVLSGFLEYSTFLLIELRYGYRNKEECISYCRLLCCWRNLDEL